jgi:hypothetical protein
LVTDHDVKPVGKIYPTVSAVNTSNQPGIDKDRVLKKKVKGLSKSLTNPPHQKSKVDGDWAAILKTLFT